MALDAEFAVDLMLLGGLIGLAYYISKMKPESIEEPDYVSKFESLAADAIMDVIEKRKATVEVAVLEDLPLEKIKDLSEDILEKFGELEQLKDELTDEAEKTRVTTRGLTMAMSAGIGERGRWGESTFEAILKMSGLVENVNYFDNLVLTKSTTNSLARPDFVDKITDGSAVAADAKRLVGPLIMLFDDAIIVNDTQVSGAAFVIVMVDIQGSVT